MLSKNAQNLIGLSGRSGNGKDFVGDIINYLVACNLGYNVNPSASNFHEWRITSDRSLYGTHFTIKKYADKLKDIVCLIIGCTRAQLEDRTFKETPLGPEWDMFECRIYENGYGYETNSGGYFIHMAPTIQSAEFFKETEEAKFRDKIRIVKIPMTPRKLLQILGTECGREIIHPNIWVNALFADYKPYSKGRALELDNGRFLDGYMHKACANCERGYHGFKRQRLCKECIEDDSLQYYPTWIISDVRFPHNEGAAITERGGINIGIMRKFSLRYPDYAHLENANDPYSIPVELKELDEKLYTNLTHASEELMGKFEWCNYIIENNGSVDELIENVAAILRQENIIKENAINIS